ncbi:hypothetical protein SEMRO_1417_G270920.1 [Seminavis robusta]|uniref:Uncharacterized protein n=1 Tax=Seminavis robusta TaxID=568900 RepID=A0A9N8EKJ6_9STRA|nr:hypothetical protein SEMRO_1417_G270920.1 [Seminavis robusta]|eukprot:Sro1417_g270920.1 n/a (129) ;mRNA; f:14284-14670
MPFIVANTFLFTPELPTVLPQDDVAAIGEAIRQGLIDAVNSGQNASLSIHIHPNRFISTGGLTFLMNVEGRIVSQSMRHLELVSHQGGRSVHVDFVGGGSLFAVAHNIDDEALAPDEGGEGNDGDGDG